MRTPVPISPSSAVAFRLLLGLFLVFAWIAVAGSLWPFRPAAHDFEVAWHSFWNLPFLEFRIGSRSDWVSNVLLFVPLGFLGAGLATGGGAHRGVVGLILAGLCLIPLVLFSCALEFAQYWFPPRIVNPLDVQAQLVGSVIGMGAWSLVGGMLVEWLGRWRELRPAWIALLGLLFLAQLAPMDLSIAPSDHKQKLARGGVELIPFRKHPLSETATQLGLFGCAVTGALMGVALVNLGRDQWLQSRSIWMNGLLLTLGMCAIEAIQLLVISRVSSTSNLVVGLVAGWLAVIVARQSQGPGGWEPLPAERGYLHLATGLATWLAGALVLCGWFWWPLEPRLERVPIERNLRLFRSQQLGSWLVSGDYDWATKSKLLWFFPLGMLLGWICRRAQVDWRLPAWPLLLLGTVLTFHLSLGTELGQALFPPHAPDQTDLALSGTLGTLGLLAGWLVARWVLPISPGQNRQNPRVPLRVSASRP